MKILSLISKSDSLLELKQNVKNNITSAHFIRKFMIGVINALGC